MTPVEFAADKPPHLIEAARQAFLRYGLRRTSMEDIAQAAGMSRAAIYLHFKNKKDVFRAVVADYYRQARNRLQAELDPAGDVAETLARAMHAKDAGVIDQILASPHGDELMGAGIDLAQDISQAGYTQICADLTAYFQAVAARQGLAAGIDPADLADFLLHAHMSLKGPDDTADRRRDRAKVLVQAVAALAGDGA